MPKHLPLLLLIATIITATSATQIGVTYIPSPSQPPPEKLVSTLRTLKITSVRLPIASEPSVLRAFYYTNISLHLTIPNNLVHSISLNRSSASFWLYAHVVPFYPRALISAISVGHDVTFGIDDVRNGGNDGVSIGGNDVIVRAVRNVHDALMDLGIRKIKVSSTFSFVGVMMTSFPPSSAVFREPVNSVVIKPLLRFLRETNSSFFVSLFPYFVYKLRPEIPIGFALFQEQAFNFRDDLITGVRYRNLFDSMVDAVVVALTVSGHEDIPLVVTETGWPSSDLLDEVEMHPLFAEMYLRGLLYHLKSGRGTPLRKEGVAEAFIYEVFDTNTSVGNGAALRVGTGQNWGFLYPNMSMKYELDFSGGFGARELLVKVVQWLLSLVIGLLVF